VSNDVNLLALAFTVYVRPLVEYCSTVWSSCLKQDIEQIEKSTAIYEEAAWI